VQGEALETQRLFDVERDESAYEEAIAGKTACLLAASCRLGALVAELDRPFVDSLTTFGHNLGMAFQIVDDVRGPRAPLPAPAAPEQVNAERPDHLSQANQVTSLQAT
jgi:hypothetical protein